MRLYYVDKNLKNSKEGFYSDNLFEHLSNGGSLQDREEVPENTKDSFHVASDIFQEIVYAGCFSESTDAGISKTINFPTKQQ